MATQTTDMGGWFEVPLGGAGGLRSGINEVQRGVLVESLSEFLGAETGGEHTGLGAGHGHREIRPAARSALARSLSSWVTR